MGNHSARASDFDDRTSRGDLLAKMRKIDAEAPTAEERAAGGVTKLRYLTFRDSLTSTPTLGFRIDAAHIVRDGEVAPLPIDFPRLREEAAVRAALLAFLQGSLPLVRKVLVKLEGLLASLERSAFLQTHLLLRSSLLLVYDGALLDREPLDVELKMIDFASSEMLPSGVVADHSSSWEGTAESMCDGYVSGVRSLVRLLKEIETG